jgi:hypothetical protein
LIDVPAGKTVTIAGFAFGSCAIRAQSISTQITRPEMVAAAHAALPLSAKLAPLLCGSPARELLAISCCKANTLLIDETTNQVWQMTWHKIYRY